MDAVEDKGGTLSGKEANVMLLPREHGNELAVTVTSNGNDDKESSKTAISSIQNDDDNKTKSSSDDDDDKNQKKNDDGGDQDARQPFRLLDLPLELQQLIFAHYISGPYDITVDYERLSMLRSKFHIVGRPDTTLFRTCKHIYTHASLAHTLGFSGRLILNSVFILVPLRKQKRFEWLRRNTTILHFSDNSVHPERWSRYWDSFEKLARLEICFPKVKECRGALGFEGGDGPLQPGTGLGERELGEILSGKRDAALVTSLDVFRLALVDQLRERGGLDVVVRQRFCARRDVNDNPLWDGLVGTDIRLSEEGSQVIRRLHVKTRLTRAMMERIPTEELIYANGNVFDAMTHQSFWEWGEIMNAE